MSPSANAQDRWARILKNCPPGVYKIGLVSELTGISVDSLSSLVKKHTHPLISTRPGKRGERGGRTITVKNQAGKTNWSKYRQQQHVSYRCVVLEPKKKPEADD